MALKTETSEISAEQYEKLREILFDKQDRVGFYVMLHLMTGSQAALDMAEMSSSSDIRGGVAWALNSAYEDIWDEYPTIGILGISTAVALVDFELIRQVGNTRRYLAPSDLNMYLGALDTWNRLGREQEPSIEGFGYALFPAVPIILLHYAEVWFRTCNKSGLEEFATRVKAGASASGIGIPVGNQILGMQAAGLWEALTAIVASSYNEGKIPCRSRARSSRTYSPGVYLARRGQTGSFQERCQRHSACHPAYPGGQHAYRRPS